MEANTTFPALLPERFVIITGRGHWYIKDPDGLDGWDTTSDCMNATRYTREGAAAIVEKHAANPFAIWAWGIEEMFTPPRAEVS